MRHAILVSLDDDFMRGGSGFAGFGRVRGGYEGREGRDGHRKGKRSERAANQEGHRVSMSLSMVRAIVRPTVRSVNA
jgi:hypothetical protein